MRAFSRTFLIFLAAIAAAAPASFGQLNELPAELRDVGIDQRVGERVPMDIPFVDEDGRRVKIGDYFRDGRPVLFTLNYSDCPMLCSVQLDALADALREVDLEPGEDFVIITISIDPNEAHEDAKAAKEGYVERTMNPRYAEGWHFLTGEEPDIRAFADAVGFHYKYIPETGEYSHPPALVVVTPAGRIARYLPSVADYQPLLLKYSIVEASEGKVGDVVDAFFLTCFHYDPSSRSYTLYATNFMRFGAALTVIGLVWFFFAMRRSERRREQTLPTADPEAARS